MNKFIDAKKLIYIGIIGAAAAFVIAAICTERTLRGARDAIEAARTAAEISDEKATAAETKAAENREKIIYLEGLLSQADEIKRRQNDELKKQKSVTRVARGRVDRAKRVRSVDTTDDELCEKLRALGHGC